VLEQAIPIEIEEKIVNIPPLPGMIILKLVAWSDRPEERADDLPDILKIIEHYFNLEFDDIVEFHHDTFPEEEDIDRYRVAAEVIGRKAGVYLDKSERLAKRIHKLMEVNLMIESEPAIAKEWARKRDWTIEYAFSILQAFQKGLLNKRK
jgi:predicted nucleotidyltransferase